MWTYSVVVFSKEGACVMVFVEVKVRGAEVVFEGVVVLTVTLCLGRW